MKFKVKLNRRHNMYFTLFACGVGIWLMVARFGLSIEKLVSFAVITIVLLVVIIGSSAAIAYLIRYIRDKGDT